MTDIQRIPFYVEMGRDVLLAWAHFPRCPSDHAVIVCPPVGHEFINSYRGMRHLADGFARKGFTTFRMEYQGVGDSSGLDTDPDRLQKWQASIERVYQFIKETCGIKRVSLFGFRMGGTLAAMVSRKVEIETLTCWEPVVEGRRYIREILALQRTGENAGLDVDSTSLEGGGFLITRETMNEILAISLLQIEPRAKQVSLFSSDDLPKPANLIETWSARAFAFHHVSLPGYADMMSLPHHSRVPVNAIEEITSQLLRANIPSEKISFPDLTPYQQARYDCYTYGLSAKESMDAGGGFPITESLCRIPNTPLFGILSLPLLRDTEHKPTVILLNAGSVHRIGPNRNYVYIARQLLSLGYPVFRLDLLGLGDSPHPNPEKENNPYMPEAMDNVRRAVGFLKKNRDGTDVILMGLCSGAYASFQAALHLEENAIREIMPINPLTFYWKEGMSLDVAPAELYEDWDTFRKSMWIKDRWKKILKRKDILSHIIATVLRVFQLKVKAYLTPLSHRIMRVFGIKGIEDLAWDLDTIAGRGVRVNFIFADTDPGVKLLMEGAGSALKKLCQHGAISIAYISKANHNFSSHRGRTQLLKRIEDHFLKRRP
ncbi:MAG: alpha/beta hydrolase [Chloroflexi bacterium]|nr:alpha/beta hydrolase [Chloroflexota bacterium]